MSALSRKHSFDLVFDSQIVYRALLSALSYPGKTENISVQINKLYGDCPELTALALTLLDNEVSCHVCGCGDLLDEFHALTGVCFAPPEAADFIFVADSSRLAQTISTAKGGTLTDPHKSATVVIRDDRTETSILRLSGPGIDRTAELPLSETVAASLAARDRAGWKYPQGIDMVFVSPGGNLTAIPRLIKGIE